ncbi:MAG: sigma-70 family RNA polymerase sigma factor, partial [Candidatus Poribacteria bacterium]|nr:sigma-70 family RNA polymerase sigma factor [Candidatus Poribacteria bacterium]
MEREDDVQLIHAVLSGDDSAFDTLIKKYQKSVHALAWRKIGDFHYAEEITQDTFLRAYENLSTLRNPSQFFGWLYVIANRLCLNWLREQKPAKHLQSLEDTPMEEVVKSDYERYVLEQRETEATEHRFEIVKKLLE